MLGLFLRLIAAAIARISFALIVTVILEKLALKVWQIRFWPFCCRLLSLLSKRGGQ